MLFQKERAGAVTPALSNTKHKDSTPVVSPIVAQSGSASSRTHYQSITAPAPIHQKHHHKVVLSGVDTLTITAGGICSPSELIQNQYQIWNEYQHSYEHNEEYSTIQIGNEWWELYPYSARHYKYQLRNDEIGFIQIWNPEKWSSGVAGKQQIRITFYSKWLHRVSKSNLFNEVNKIISHLVDNINTISIQISRLDLHTDITNGSSFLTQEQVDNTISKSKVRQNYYEDTELKLTEQEEELLTHPLINNKGVVKLPKTLLDKLLKNYTDQNLFGATSTIRKRELETCYFGKKTSSLWGKFYNKSAEVKNKNDTDTPLLWLDNGYNGNDIVVRVEFSMRRDFLKEIDNGLYVDLRHAVNNFDKIWDYLTNKWLRMVEYVSKNNTQKSKITLFWECVVNAFNVPLCSVIRKKNYNAKINQLWSQGIGCIKQMISIGMNDNEDTGFMNSVNQAVNQVLLSSYHNNEYFERRKHLGIA